MNAIILAGGRGTRLEPWHAPKCLMPVNGVTILQRLLDHLFPSEPIGSVERAVICTGYRGNNVERSVRVHGWNVGNTDEDQILFSDAGEDTSMGVRLMKARALAGADYSRVLICYGDELADVNVAELVAQHEKRKSLVTFAVALTKVAGGTVEIEAGMPVIIESAEMPINIGFVVVEPQCWELLSPEDGLSDWINRIGKGVFGAVAFYKHLGRRATINSLADLKYAEEVWK